MSCHTEWLHTVYILHLFSAWRLWTLCSHTETKISNVQWEGYTIIFDSLHNFLLCSVDSWLNYACIWSTLTNYNFTFDKQCTMFIWASCMLENTEEKNWKLQWSNPIEKPFHRQLSLSHYSTLFSVPYYSLFLSICRNPSLFQAIFFPSWLSPQTASQLLLAADKKQICAK